MRRERGSTGVAKRRPSACYASRPVEPLSSARLRYTVSPCENRYLRRLRTWLPEARHRMRTYRHRASRWSRRRSRRRAIAPSSRARAGPSGRPRCHGHPEHRLETRRPSSPRWRSRRFSANGSRPPPPYGSVCVK